MYLAMVENWVCSVFGGRNETNRIPIWKMDEDGTRQRVEKNTATDQSEAS